MAKKRGFMMLTLSLAMGLFAAWAAGNWVRRAGATPETAMATVVAAEIAIPFGTKVDQRHLKTLQMPVEYIPPGSFAIGPDRVLVGEDADPEGTVALRAGIHGSAVGTDRARCR